MIVNAYCSCGCGQQTAIRDVSPDMAEKARKFGLIPGHKEKIVTVDQNKAMLAAFIVERAMKSQGII